MNYYTKYQTDSEFSLAFLEASRQKWDHFLYEGEEYSTEEIKKELDGVW